MHRSLLYALLFDTFGGSLASTPTSLDVELMRVSLEQQRTCAAMDERGACVMRAALRDEGALHELRCACDCATGGAGQSAGGGERETVVPPSHENFQKVRDRSEA